MVTCAHCGVVFGKKPSVAAKHKFHFCCREHMIGFRRTHGKQWPTEDCVSEHGVTIFWSQHFYERDNRGRMWYRVPVTCCCGTSRSVDAHNAANYKYKGMCPECLSRLRLNAKGPDTYLPSNGRVVNNMGYVFIHWSTVLPLELESFRTMLTKTSRTNAYFLEHRLVMARHLGRPLERKEIVHHKNGIKTDNRLENLEIVTASEHQKLDHKYYALWLEATERIKKLEAELALLKGG